MHKWGVRYLTGRSKGQDGDDDDDDAVASPVGDWRPSPEVMSLFEALGAQEWLDFDIIEGRPRDEDMDRPLFRS